MSRVKWAYDASTSRTLRAVSHLPVAAIGGAFLLAAGLVGVQVVTAPALPDPRVLLFVGLLVLVGGPFSLLYLWPMLTDPDQRPSTAEFAGAEGFPFSFRSVAAAAGLGAAAIAGLLAIGLPFDATYGIAVAAVFSPIAVAAVTTRGRLADGELAIDGTDVPLERVAGVRSIRFGDVVVCWISYAPRSGAFLPRLFAVPAESADAVRETLRGGAGRSPDAEGFGAVARVVLLAVGVSFLAAAALAYASVQARLVGGYLAALVGGIGVLCCAAAWRGL